VDTVGEAVNVAERVCKVVTQGVREPGRERPTVGELEAAAVVEWDRCGERNVEGQGEDKSEPRDCWTGRGARGKRGCRGERTSVPRLRGSRKGALPGMPRQAVLPRGLEGAIGLQTPEEGAHSTRCRGGGTRRHARGPGAQARAAGRAAHRARGK
jgi:hypothetical protein